MSLGRKLRLGTRSTRTSRRLNTSYNYLSLTAVEDSSVKLALKIRDSRLLCKRSICLPLAV